MRYDLGLAHHRLAEIHRELGDYAAAEDSSTKAIAALGNLAHAQPRVVEYQRDLAASYSTLGVVYMNTARWGKAEAAYQQALLIQKEQLATDPQSAEERHALAKTYSALGLACQQADRPESAATMCQKAQDILSKLVQEYPNRSEYQLLLAATQAATQMNLGQVYVMKGWHEKADTALKEAGNIYERLVQGRLDVLPEDRQSLARTHALLGMAYRGSNQAGKAEQEQRKALHSFEKLAQEHPDILEYAYDVGRCYLELGRTAELAGRPESALERYAKSIEIMQETMGKGYLRARLILQDARLGRASALVARGGYARAAEEAEAVVRQGDVGALIVYNAACVLSLASAAADHDTKLSPTDRTGLKARYADRAIDLLHKAIAKGYRNPRIIKEDRDLDPLRARQDFQKLLADLEASSASK